MKANDFTNIAARYDQDSLIQRSAAEKLIGLLDIRRSDDVLDLGCGTGAMARKIRSLTDGNVVGVDSSPGMISEAGNGRQGLNITYEVKTSEELDYRDRFTVIFCNSAFQWFRDPGLALKKCHTALRKGGRMGIQAPAKKMYCPNFVKAVDAVATDARTTKTFAGFKAPWLFLDSAKEYDNLFEHAGFTVPFSVIEEVRTLHSPDEVMTIFESGAAAGYLNQDYYAAPFEGAYTAAFRELVRKAFRQQANHDGNVELIFNRIYLVAMKA